MSPLSRFLAPVLFLLLSQIAEAVPTVSLRAPAANATVGLLSSVSITFSETVTGVDADDLLINADGALFVTGSGAGP